MDAHTFLNQKLFLICFLDSLSLGCIIPVLSKHIFTLDGNHTFLGFLSAHHFLSQQFSGPVTRTWHSKYGRKNTLVITLGLNLIAQIYLGITTSYYVIFILRTVYALTSQTQTLCKSFVAELNHVNRLESINSILNALSVAGFIIGPMLGGFIYEYEHGFYYISLLAAFCIFLNLLIGLTLPKDSNKINKTSHNADGLLFKIREEYNNSYNSFKNVNMSLNWQKILLKVFYHTSVTLFFIKFSMLLTVNYQASSTIIGLTYAYQNILTFLSQLALALIKTKVTPFTYQSLQLAFFSINISFYFLCYAPSYDQYLAACIPMIFAHTLINSNWKNIFQASSSKGNSIEGFDDVTSKVVSLTMPIALGYFCDLYGHIALKFFVIVPLIFDLIIVIVFNLDRSESAQTRDKKD